MDVKSRIYQFIEKQGLRKAEFERMVGLSNGYLNNFKGNFGPQKLNNILSVFPQLNKVWLLTGEGEMLNPPKNPFNQMSESEIQDTIAIELAKLYEQGVLYPASVHEKIVRRLELRIEELVRENNDLRRQLDALKKM